MSTKLFYLLCGEFKQLNTEETEACSRLLSMRPFVTENSKLLYVLKGEVEWCKTWTRIIHGRQIQTLVIAILATVVGSQAIITGTFSQLSLHFCPKTKLLIGSVRLYILTRMSSILELLSSWYTISAQFILRICCCCY
ncbi:uncharacterized protein LOC132056777 [Lycium ferocissimum]|uniref:uncharacterized protein LOC132056777 n=1 Tax=Lycium ferocissimum TaxID=112874 RepID=UPI0028152D66|nr:uncharacterized protein LOC132056777 [Lycium ferocissimum]XP_059305109.1 uncharacterized protein LOC132056777 [Lycium ferocissimum]